MKLKHALPLLLLLMIGLCAVVRGQTSWPRGAMTSPTTVAFLPAIGNSNLLYDVRDANPNCATGGGSARVVCHWNGASYDTVNVGGSGGGITNSAGNTIIPMSDGTNIVASYLTNASNAVFPTTAGATDLGSATKPFQFVFMSGSSGTPGTNNFKFIGASTSGTRTITLPDSNTLVPITTQLLTFAGPTASRTITFPDAAITVARTDAANTFTGVQTFSTSVVSPIHSSNNADPADAGIVRLGNNEAIGWEAATPGTDLTLKVNTSDQLEASGAVKVGGVLTAGSGPTTVTDSAGKVLSAALNTVAVANGGTGLTAGTSGGILGYTASGTLASSVALTANVLVKGGGAGATPTNSLLTDDATTLTYTGTGGFSITSTVAGAESFFEGTTPAAAAANSIKLQAPVDVTTAYDLILPAASATGFLLCTNSSNICTSTFINFTGTNTVVRDTTPTINTPVFAGGLTASGSGANTFAGSSGTFLTSTGAVTIGPGAVGVSGIPTFTPPVRTSGSASYFTLNTPADTGITANTESIGFNSVTGTRTFADGTVTLQRERFLAGPTYNKTTTALTITDVFNTYLTPPVAGAGVTFTRPHTWGVVDSTSASSSITGAVVISAALGTTATSVGIGGGNINAGGNGTFGGTLGVTGAQTNSNTITQTSTSATAFESGPNGATNPVLRLVNSVASAATGLSVTGRAATAGADITVLSSGSNEDLNLVPKGTGSVNIGAAPDVGIARTSAGLLEVNSGTAGTLRDITTRNTNAATFTTATNCSDSAGAAACGSASAGAVVIDAAATAVTVSTTAVTANSEIFITEDSSLNTRLGITCNTTIARTYTVTARTAGTSFVITTSAAPITNAACLNYRILN